MNKLKTILFDIETSPNISYTWGKYEQDVIEFIEEGRILTFAYKELGSRKVNAFSINQFKSEDKFIKELWNMFDNADVLIAHNGDNFDVKWGNRMFAKYKLTPPSPYKTIDTLKIARQKFKFNSNKLDDLGNYLSVGRKIKHEGFGLWKKCMAGDNKAYKDMCITPNHKLLGKDLRWKEARDFNVGDSILGFDENGRGRKYKNSIIESIEYSNQPVYKVTLSSGKEFEVTEDHKWLVINWVSGRVGGYKWKKTNELKNTDGIPKLLNVWEEDNNKESGWLSGMFDGEGTLYNRKNGSGCAITIAQNEGNVLNRIIKTIKTYTQNLRIYDYASGKNGKCRTVMILGTTNERLEFLGRVRPERLIEKVDFNNLGRLESRNKIDMINSVEFVGEKQIIIIGTSTNTFICDGYPMHNCKYNKQDVVLLENVYLKLRPYITNHPVVNISPEFICPVCGKNHIQKRGWMFTNTFMKQRLQCQDCGKWFLGQQIRYKDKENTLK